MRSTAPVRSVSSTSYTPTRHCHGLVIDGVHTSVTRPPVSRIVPSVVLHSCRTVSESTDLRTWPRADQPVRLTGWPLAMIGQAKFHVAPCGMDRGVGLRTRCNIGSADRLDLELAVGRVLHVRPQRARLRNERGVLDLDEVARDLRVVLRADPGVAAAPPVDVADPHGVRRRGA